MYMHVESFTTFSFSLLPPAVFREMNIYNYGRFMIETHNPSRRINRLVLFVQCKGRFTRYDLSVRFVGPIYRPDCLTADERPIHGNENRSD